LSATLAFKFVDRARAKIAMVAQDGKALGIITLKDLIEEITGELRDL